MELDDLFFDMDKLENLDMSREFAWDKLEIPYHRITKSTGEWLGFKREVSSLDIIRSMRQAAEGGDCEAVNSAKTLSAQYRPQTVTELLDAQIAFHTKKIADLNEAKAAISPEVEKAINALAKL